VHADTLDGVLRVALNDLRRFDTRAVEDRRHDVDGMVILVAQLVLALDTLRPVNQKRVADAAVIAIALPHLERRVEGHGPAGGVIVVGQGTAPKLYPFYTLW